MLDDGPTTDESEAGALELIIHSAEVGPAVDDFRPLRILTSRGTVDGRLYAVTRATHAVVFAGDGEGWASPAHDLFGRLGQQLRQRSVSALHVRFRAPGVLKECVLDLLAGIAYLESENVHSIALVGHGFGAAVIIEAGAASSSVRALVSLAPAGAGGDAAGQATPCCPMLVINASENAPLAEPSDGEQPRRILTFPQAGPQLDEVADAVQEAILDWIKRSLRR